jgi:hypothetical protein
MTSPNFCVSKTFATAFAASSSPVLSSLAPNNHAHVADLPSAFRIERRFVKDNPNLVIFLLDGDDRCFTCQNSVRFGHPSDEGSWWQPFKFARFKGRCEPHPLSRSLPLQLKFLIEAFFVNGQAVFGTNLFCQLQREAVGVIERESVSPSQDRFAPRLRFGNHLLKPSHADFKGLLETALLRA